MIEHDIDNYQQFHQWLGEEKAYLLGLKADSKARVESPEMEYVTSLVNLDASK